MTPKYTPTSRQRLCAKSCASLLYPLRWYYQIFEFLPFCCLYHKVFVFISLMTEVKYLFLYLLAVWDSSTLLPFSSPLPLRGLESYIPVCVLPYELSSWSLWSQCPFCSSSSFFLDGLSLSFANFFFVPFSADFFSVLCCGVMTPSH